MKGSSARRPPRYHSIGIHARTRPTWNKYNLFNMVRQSYRGDIYRERKTFFQQKWIAKSLARGYHGDHIREKQWRRLFSRRLLSAVDMPAKYLALYDGSEQGSGRGSGAATADGRTISAQQFSPVEDRRMALLKREASLLPKDKNFAHSAQKRRARDSSSAMIEKPVRSMTPYMQMMWAPLERRLDMAIFRALFASSPRQARQFCVHGKVKVNGQRMPYPGYLLNPGDMFQVDIEGVLRATGREKTAEEGRLHRAQKNVLLKEAAIKAKEKRARDHAMGVNRPNYMSKKGKILSQPTEPKAVDSVVEPPAPKKKPERKDIQSLILIAKDLLSHKTTVDNERYEEIHSFSKMLKRVIDGRPSTAGESLTMDALATMLRSLKLDPVDTSTLAQEVKDVKAMPSDLPEVSRETARAAHGETTDEPAANSSEERADSTGQEAAEAQKLDIPTGLSRGEQMALARLILESESNPVDYTKPYSTPWRPRPYLAPFAFIPRYLEVNQNVCAAVYLRHPVSRPGLAEIPSPFPYEVNQLAFNWYLRRR